MDTLLIILLALTTVAIPAFDRGCGCRSHLRRMGERGVCVKVRPHGPRRQYAKSRHPGSRRLSELLGAGGNTPFEIIPLSLC